MITLFDSCPASQTFLVLYFTTVAIISFNYFTQPVDIYCIKKSGNDCGEKRKDCWIHLITVSLLGLLWTWIIVIVYHSVSSFFSWILVFLPFMAFLCWYGYQFFPVFQVSLPVGITKSSFYNIKDY